MTNKIEAKKIVIDSCIFNKLYLDEEDSINAVDYIKKINIAGYKILVPSIFLYEVLGVAEYYRYDTEIIYDLILDYQNNNLEIITPDDVLIKKSLEMTRNGHDKSGYPTFYDCVYHALAIQNNCNFITADNKHYAKVKHIGHIRLLNDIA